VLNWPGGGDATPPPSGWRHTLQRLGPGIVAGAADLDPAAVMTAVVAGATFGYSIGWVVLACVPVLMTVFSVASRLGDESRKGLVQLIREHHGKIAAMITSMAMVAVNVTMIIADLRAVGEAFSLILNTSFLYFLAPVAFSVWWILMKGNFQRVIKVLAWLALAQLAYIAAAVMVTPSATSLLRGIFLPHISPRPEYAIGLLAVFGSLLTPDVIVWQTSSRKDSSQASAGHTQESRAGTLVAAAVSLSAIISASVLHVQSPGDLTTRTAALALSPLGPIAPLVFSLGILGSGFVALPILISSMCFSIAEAADWKSGLNQNPWEAPLYYTLMSVVVVFAVVVNYAHLNTVKVLYFSQVVAGALTVPILWYMLRLSNNRAIVQRTNTVWQNFWLGGAIGGTIAANGILIWSLLR
jgi:Mn2+/Fe2+ NRAMP family transporter